MKRLTNGESTGTEMVADSDPLAAAMKASASSGGGGNRESAVKLVDRLLHGRYHWAILLSLALGAAGAYAGWKRGAQTFSSTGVIKINNYLNPLLFQTGDTQPIPAFDSYVKTQATAILSRPMIEEALRDPKWMAIEPVHTDMSVIDFMNRLKVTQDDDQVKVEARDTQAEVATAAANAIISAYEKLVIQPMQDPEKDERMKPLQQAESDLETKSHNVSSQMLAIATKYGSESLDAEYNAKESQVSKLDSTMQELELAIAVDPAKQVIPLAASMPGVLEIADPELGKLKVQLSDAQLNRQRVQSGTSALARQAADSEVDLAQQLYDERLSALQKAIAMGVSLPNFPTVHTEQQLDELKEELKVLQPKADALRRELVDLGNENMRLAQLRQEKQDDDKDLDTIKQRIHQIRFEIPTTGRRIEVQSRGDLPLIPDKDSRPKLAALGGFGGGLIGTLAVMLIGLISGRLRAPRDLPAMVEAKPVLGVIPHLEAGPDFAKRAALAADCVHRTRTMLEIWGRGSKNLVIGVTSPSHGAGNTSVAMSLGVSFAAAGMRTLLVDCDFVTTGLTPRFQTIVKRDLGKVLLRTGLITESQLRHATTLMGEEATNGEKRTIGEVCLGLGYITQAELDAALAAQQKDHAGIMDALEGEDLRQCVGKTGIRNLSILPRGTATPAHAAKLCSQSLRQVLDNAREHFDTIIVDTSAMLSALEASIVASAVDGMVVTVARGEQRGRFEETLTRLKSLQCPLAGIIFNQVLPGDVRAPIPIESMGVDTDGLVNAADLVETDVDLVGRLGALGPLTSSIVSRIPVSATEGEIG